LDELLAALRLPNIRAVFDAIGRDALPGSTADERAEIRHVAACVPLDALQAGGVPLPVATPSPETLILWSVGKMSVVVQAECQWSPLWSFNHEAWPPRPCVDVMVRASVLTAHSRRGSSGSTSRQWRRFAIVERQDNVSGCASV
jgi:hypothetical protein